MKLFFQKRWFLVALVVLIAGGLTFGSQSSADRAGELTGLFPPRLITAIVLFLMSFSLDGRQLRASLAAPGPVAWASLVNFGLIPALAWALMPLQQTPDFRYGLMIAASVPCTMAAASVWTRKAGGNDAVSLLVTVVTNGLCFVVTPFWLTLTTARNIDLDLWGMFVRLVEAALVPMVAGQAVRQFRGPARFAVRYKTPIGVVAQVCILALVFSAAANAGTRLNGSETRPDAGATLIVWGTCIGVHAAALIVGMLGGGLFGFSRADLAAVAFASSQKTLPIGVLVATDPAMFGDPNLLESGVGVPFAVFPMLMYHASQLFVDTAVADRLAARAGAEGGLSTETAGQNDG